MILLKDLLVERIVLPDEFMREIKRAEKETGKKFKVPSSTKKLCMEAKKDGFHKLDYLGKPGKARKPESLMYQAYAFVQGWGHSKYKNKWDWRSDKSQPVLQNIQNSSIFSSLFDYEYLEYHVKTDLQASQVVANIRPGSKDVEPAYYLVKDYLNSFGTRGKNRRDDDILTNKVHWWLNKNKVETL